MVQSSVDILQMKQMRKKVYAHMLQTRSWKYRIFLRQLKLFKYLALAPTRGTFLESYYVLMRYLDDITDGDYTLPEGEQDVVTYLQSKIRFAQNPADPKDQADYMMIWCYELGHKFGKDFTNETIDILESLLFDAKRRDTLKFFSHDTLTRHFHQMDIKGTIRATLKVFNDDPEKYLMLEPLGMASRYQYDIEDIKTDLDAGYVNITVEEATALEIGEDQLRNPDSPEIKRWLRKHAVDGLKLLETHREMLRKHGEQFSWLQKVAFKRIYERPARQVFERTLAKTEHLA